jgi:hypothetical protein
MNTPSSVRWYPAVLVLLVAAGWSAAQPPGPPPNPTVSPYLNLLRNGASPAVNYFGLVRPEQRTRQALQGLQTTQSSTMRTLNDLMTGDTPGTGVPAQFLNHGGFFLTQRSGGFGGGGMTPGLRSGQGQAGGSPPGQQLGGGGAPTRR